MTSTDQLFPWWQVTIETRQRGAIVLWYKKVFRVRANCFDYARSSALSDANADGLETRFVLHVQKEPEI